MNKINPLSESDLWEDPQGTQKSFPLHKHGLCLHFPHTRPAFKPCPHTGCWRLYMLLLAGNSDSHSPLPAPWSPSGLAKDMSAPHLSRAMEVTISNRRKTSRICLPLEPWQIRSVNQVFGGQVKSVLFPLSSHLYLFFTLCPVLSSEKVPINQFKNMS